MHRVKDLVSEPGAKHPKMTKADIRQIRNHTEKPQPEPATQQLQNQQCWVLKHQPWAEYHSKIPHRSSTESDFRTCRTQYCYEGIPKKESFFRTLDSPLPFRMLQSFSIDIMECFDS